MQNEDVIGSGCYPSSGDTGDIGGEFLEKIIYDMQLQLFVDPDDWTGFEKAERGRDHNTLGIQEKVIFMGSLRKEIEEYTV